MTSGAGSTPPLVSLHRARGEHRDVAGLARQALRTMGDDHVRAARLLVMLIEAQLALGDAAAAEASVILLDQIAAAREPPVLAARAALARGMVAQHRSQRDAAREAFEYGLAALADFRWPLLLAELRLRLGQVLAEPDAPAAIAEARAAHLRTIEHHVSAILAKLGLRSRAEAAVYAASLETAQPLTAEA